MSVETTTYRVEDYDFTNTNLPQRRMRREEGNERRKRYNNFNFERYVQQGNHFINEVAAELGTRNRNKAVRITRAILHALRDRLMPDDAVEFAQGLPMAIKGLYFDQYDLSRSPIRIRRREDFINYILVKDKFTDMEDFPDPEIDVARSLQAVWHVLRSTMDRGQVNKIKHELPSDIVAMIEEIIE